MELVSNLLVVCMFVMWMVSLCKDKKVAPVVEPAVETEVKYLSDLTFKEIVELLGEEYIWGVCEEKVVDLTDYKARFKRKIQEQLNNEDEGIIYVPTDELDDGLFSFNPNMHRRRESRYDDIKEKARKPRIQRFGSIVLA